MQIVLPEGWRPLALPQIEHWEGFRSKPYLCPAGKWTIGFGTTKYPDGRKVGPNDPEITPEQAFAYLEISAGRVADDLLLLLKRQPTVHQAAAFVMIAYNIGVGAHDGIKGDLADSTLIEKFNRGDIAGAADQFLLWNKAHERGRLVTLPGLTYRRKEERDLFLTPDTTPAKAA